MPNAELVPFGKGQLGSYLVTVHTPSGRRMLRIYDNFFREKRTWLGFAGQLQLAASQAGVSVARPCFTETNEFIVDHAGYQMCLHEWTEGEPNWPPTPDQAVALGKAIAKLHSAYDGVAGITVYEFDIPHLISRPFSLLKKYLDGVPRAHERLYRATNRLVEQASKLATDSKGYGPIYGTFAPSCVMFNGNTPTFADPVLAGVGYRAYDLACLGASLAEDPAAPPASRNAFLTIVDSYRKHYELSDRDIAMLPMLMQVHTLWQAGLGVELGGMFQRPDMAQHVAMWALEAISEPSRLGV